MKKFLGILSMCALLIVASGCSSSNEFSATSKGYGGDVTVTITVDGDKITNVDIKGDKETPNVGTNAIEQLPEKIVAANSYDVDVVSGATVTSEAIKEATKEAMKQAGLLK